MTASPSSTATEAAGAAAGTGRVVQIIGPVVDVEFPAEQIPGIYNALHVNVTLGDRERTLTLEVAQDIGDNVVRAISMQPTDGLGREAPVTDTGGPISGPGGGVTKGPVGNGLRETPAAPPTSPKTT